MAVTSRPIWKDCVVDLGAKESESYTIADSSIFYSGTAHRRPEDTTLKVKINDIIAGRLHQQFPTLTDEVETIGTLGKTFTIATPSGNHQEEVRLDWSYDREFNPDLHGGILSAPITGRVSPRQRIPFTKIGDAPETTIVFYDANGNPIDFNYTEYHDFNVMQTIPEGSVYAILNGIRYDISGGCEGYCLYYVNEYGGWDSFLLEGRGIRTDDYKRYTHKREYDNTDTIQAGKVAYLNDITRRYELHTGWLTGGQGGRMHHLLGSNLVYLHDLEKDIIHPVIITDNSCKYRDYHNNGAQLVDYTINVEVARDYKRQ